MAPADNHVRQVLTHDRKQSTPEGRPAVTVWTIGHSTRPLQEFLDLLAEHRIQTVVDVRAHPGSRKYPQYGQDALADTLRAQDIEYQWFKGLGGRRRASADSPNTAWRNASFRGYADYMSTADFRYALDALYELAARSRMALMCAEAVWWRCHRSMIADALCVEGAQVLHIMNAGHCVTHPMTSPARIVDGKLTYAL